MLRMVGAAGIEHAADRGMRGQRVGDAAGIGAVALDAQAERLQALDQDPGVERAERRAGVADDRLQLFEDEFLRTSTAPPGATLTVDVLGGGVDHDVGAELQRPLQDRRGEGVVEDDLGAGPVREVAHRLHVDDVEHGLDGDSNSTACVGLLSALSHCARSPPSTSSLSMPYFGSSSATM